MRNAATTTLVGNDFCTKIFRFDFVGMRVVSRGVAKCFHHHDHQQHR
jgi:hypothetical protein